MGQQDFHISLILMVAALMMTDVLTHTTSPPDVTQEATSQRPLTTPPLILPPGGELQAVSHHLTTPTFKLQPGDTTEELTSQLPITTRPPNLTPVNTPPGVTSKPVMTPMGVTNNPPMAPMVINYTPPMTPVGITGKPKVQSPPRTLAWATDKPPMTTVGLTGKPKVQSPPMTPVGATDKPPKIPVGVTATPPVTPREITDITEVNNFAVLAIFDENVLRGKTFVDKILFIEDQVCGGLCDVYPRQGHFYRKDVCDACKCDRQCTAYHDCCPHVTLQHGVVHEGVDLSSCRLTYPVPVSQPVSEDSPYQKIFDKCPGATRRMETNTEDTDPLVSQAKDSTQNLDVFKCENPNSTEPDQFLFVSSAISGFSYRNKYCAACHNDTENLQKWKASLSCDGNAGQLLSQVSSRYELHRVLLSPDEVNKTGCHLRYQSPDAVEYYRTCRPQVSNIISTCNVTGNIHYYDPRIEQACGMYTSVFDRKYKNMFCFMCNRNFPPIDPLGAMIVYTQTKLPSHIGRVSFSALVDFDDDDSSHSFSEGNAERIQTAADCLQNEYYDTLACECRTPVCSEGKYLTINGSCESLILTNVLGYRVCFDLHIETASEISWENMDHLRSQLMLWPYSLSHINYVKTWCPGSKAATVAVDELFLQQGSGYLEDIEEEIAKRFATFNTSAFPNSQLDVVRYRISLTDKCFNDTLAGDVCDTSPFIVFLPLYRPPLLFPGYDLGKIYFISFLHTSQCPFVVLPRENFNATDQNYSFIFKPTKKMISASNIDEISESDVQVCVYDYILLTETDVLVCRQKEDDFDTWTISGLISIICTCISLFCLLLTFITYCIFPALRNGGGKNIMTLIVTLFTAQAFYEFAIEQFENRTACEAFGFIIHYTWLAAVFSMNACTIERFYKLCFPLKSRTFFLTKKPFTLATVYTFACPIVIVIINIISNMATRDDIGYGSPRLCYINTSASRIFAFALPMGLAVVFNIILMVITIYILRRKTDITTKSSSQARIGLVACARLSMITGLMWLLAFLYEAIPSEVLSYFITALIGLQGVFFFISMGLNKRVLALYSDLYTRWRKTLTLANSDSHRNESARTLDKGTRSTTLTMSSKGSTEDSSSSNREEEFTKI